MGITKDGGRNWDTTYTMPDKDNSIDFKYLINRDNKDSGFWMGVYRNSSINSGSFISYDDFKTIKKLDNNDHLSLFGFDTENIISRISEFNGNNIAIYPQRYKAGISQNVSKNYEVYPNPFKNEITIKTSQIAEITIYNLEGKPLVNENLNAGENILKLNDFVIGIYILEIKTGNQIERIKLVKTN